MHKVFKLVLLCSFVIFTESIGEESKVVKGSTFKERISSIDELINKMIKENNISKSKINSLEKENKLLKYKVEELEGKNYPIFYSTGLKEDGKDNGYVDDRNLIFMKKEKDTAIKLTYTDNLRVIGSTKACRWELKIEDINNHNINCNSEKLIFSLYSGLENNHHRVSSFSGICENLPKGTYNLRVYITNKSLEEGGIGECDTGWYTKWTLQAQEFEKGKVD